MRKFLVVFLALLTPFAFGQSTKRVALIIGAQNYEVLPSLRNSLNDAQSIKRVLQTMQGNLMFGYSVMNNQLSLSANGIVVTYYKQ